MQEVVADTEGKDAVEGSSEGSVGDLLLLAPSSDDSSHDEVHHHKGKQKREDTHLQEVVIKVEFTHSGFLGRSEVLDGMSPWHVAGLGDETRVPSSRGNCANG